MQPTLPQAPLRLALPKGRQQKSLFTLLDEAGLGVRSSSRGYRPTLPGQNFETKLLKPQSIVEMLRAGSRDLGFAGADWVAEREAPLVRLLDTELDPVRIVAAGPPEIAEQLGTRPLVIASEYEGLARRWAKERGYDARIVRSFGGTEVYPPEDADLIVDNCSTGDTLRANGLVEFEVLMESSTGFYASPQALESPEKRQRIESFALVLRSVVEARKRVMLELNVAESDLESVIETLPSMKRATVSPLHGGTGFAVKAAVPRRDLAGLVPLVKERGGSDIVVSAFTQIVP